MGATFAVTGNILQIKLDGELDHHCAATIRQEADAYIEEKNLTHIIFDYTNISFMDSSGIGFVMGRHKKVHEKGGKTAITGSNPYVDKLFELSGIYQIVKKCKCYQDAEAYIKGER